MRFICYLGLTLCLGACNTVSSLHYEPTALALAAATPSIGAVTSSDQRREAPTRLATIMGGFGNPLKTLDTAKPVKDEVAQAFIEGLQLRGLWMPQETAPLHIELLIRKFDADMIIGRTARIDLTLSVMDRSGHLIYRDTAVDQQSDMKFFETGILADIGDLRMLTEAVLSRTVDHMLDNPAFRTAVTLTTPTS